MKRFIASACLSFFALVATVHQDCGAIALPASRDFKVTVYRASLSTVAGAAVKLIVWDPSAAQLQTYTYNAVTGLNGETSVIATGFPPDKTLVVDAIVTYPMNPSRIATRELTIPGGGENPAHFGVIFDGIQEYQNLGVSIE